MRDSEIKTLFAKADEQVHVDEIRKQKTYYAMIEEMEKQRTPMMSTKNILLHQFWYMDKLFFAVYGVLICLGKTGAGVIGIECVIALVFWCVAYGTFNYGLKFYESAGN